MTTWFANRFIATKIMMVFGAVVAVGTAVAIIGAAKLAQLSDAQTWAQHTYEVLNMSKEVLAALTRQEHATSAAVRGGESKLINDANAQAIDRAVAKLRAATVDNPSQQSRIDALSAAIAAWRAQVPGSGGRLEAANAVFVVLRAIDVEERRLLTIRTASAREAFRTFDRVNVFGPVVASAVALALGILLHQFIARPIAGLTLAMRRLAAGEDAAVPNMDRGDEIGAMSRALDVFKSGMREAERLRENGRIMRREGEMERAALVKTMADRFETIVGSVVQAVSASATKMQGSAEELRGLADRTSGQVRDVALATKDVSATMRDAAEEAELLSGSVGEISARMEYSERVALQAVEEAIRTSATIEGLSSAAKRIDAIVDLINAVARQTNLLALNATIESARAGEAGRGFAVVAAEVKVLADRTAEATEDIRRQIEEIQVAASGSVAAIGQIGRTIREMARITGEVNAAVDLQRDGTMATALSTRATAGVATEVSGRLTLVSADALTTGRAATDLLAAARDLAHQSRTLREETGRFVTSVRTG